MSEVLSQNEIDALLSAMSSGGLEASQAEERADDQQVRPFDFMRPSKFSKDQLRTIELLHDAFCRSAQTGLSASLRTIVEIEVMAADQVTYGEFVTSMPTPSLITIVTMEPLEGNAVVELNLPIAFSIIDRLVGGPGTHRLRLRELTEIEHALLHGVIETLLRGFSEAWSTVFPARFRRVGVETNPQFAQIVTPSDMVMLITFEIRVGGLSGTISLCVPYLVLEPVMERLTAQSYFSGRSTDPSPEVREGLVGELGGVSIPVSVELGRASLTVGDLIALAPGDVIPLAVAPGSDAVLRVGSREAFHVQPGVRGRRAAVQVTGRIQDLERTWT